MRARGAFVIGHGVRLERGPVPTHIVVEQGAALTLGDGVSIGFGSGIACSKSIRVDADVVIGPFVQLLDSDHHVAGRHEQAALPVPIEIGRGARIGAWATILPGSVIGAGAIISAGSVVSGMVADHASVVGNPARQHRAREACGATAQVVCDVVVALFSPDCDVVESTRRSDIDRWNSLGSLRLLVELEEAFGVSLAEQAVSQADTVGELIDAAKAARCLPDAPLQ